MQGRQSRAATIRLVGGRPCLDLVNTVSWRSVPERRQDHLLGVGDALTWCVRAGIHSQDEADVLARELDPRRAGRMVHELVSKREQIWTHLVAAEGAGDSSDSSDLSELSPLITAVLPHCVLGTAGASPARWTVPTLDEHTAARRIALDLLDLLLHPVGRIGRCADPTCQWAFVDTSRAQNRRWCSSADCGNRDRVRRHHAKRG